MIEVYCSRFGNLCSYLPEALSLLPLLCVELNSLPDTGLVNFCCRWQHLSHSSTARVEVCLRGTVQFKTFFTLISESRFAQLLTQTRCAHYHRYLTLNINPPSRDCTSTTEQAQNKMCPITGGQNQSLNLLMIFKKIMSTFTKCILQGEEKLYCQYTVNIVFSQRILIL